MHAHSRHLVPIPNLGTRPGPFPTPLHADALGLAFETLDDDGVTELYRLMVATAAERLGLAPRLVPVDRPSAPVHGRSHRNHTPGGQVVHSTRGYRRDHWPNLHHVILELMVAPQAGIRVCMSPLRGHRRDAPACGQVVRALEQARGGIIPYVFPHSEGRM